MKERFRALCLFITLLFATTQTSAQTLSVYSFKSADSDLTAMTTPRTDESGKTCALVKIYVYDDITSVEGGAVGEPVVNGIEKRIYLCDGVKSFTLNLKHHYSIKISFADYGMEQAESNKVYMLKISDGTVTDNDAVDTPSASEINVNNQSKTTEKEKNFMTIIVNGVQFDMVFVKGGTFLMGDNDEDWAKPEHKVTLSDYYIGRMEVNQSLWKAVMDNNPSAHQDETGNYPVEMVSWYDCKRFVKKLSEMTGYSFALPTEAEWEYAARGGIKSKDYKYAGANKIEKVAWYSENGGNVTHYCGTSMNNELGIFDMSGNVWEWCADWYDNYNGLLQTNPTGPITGTHRVLRGGCIDQSYNSCTIKNRGRNVPTLKSRTVGLRLVMHM